MPIVDYMNKFNLQVGWLEPSGLYSICDDVNKKLYDLSSTTEEEVIKLAKKSLDTGDNLLLEAFKDKQIPYPIYDEDCLY